MNNIDNLNDEEKIQILESLLNDEALSKLIFENSELTKKLGLESSLPTNDATEHKKSDLSSFKNSSVQREFASDAESLSQFLVRKDVKAAIARNNSCIKGLVTIPEFRNELCSIDWFLKHVSQNQQVIDLVMADLPANAILLEKFLSDSRVKNAIQARDGYLEGLVQNVSQRIAKLSTIKNHFISDDSLVSYLLTDNDFLRLVLARKRVKRYIVNDLHYLEQLSLGPELASNLLKVGKFTSRFLSESDNFNLFISNQKVLDSFLEHLSQAAIVKSGQSWKFLETVARMRDFSGLLAQVSEYLAVPEGNSDKVELSFKKIANGSKDFQNLLALIFNSNNSVSINGKPFRILDWRGFWIPFQEIFLNKDYDIVVESEKPFFIDAGANIGLATLYLKCKHPSAEVICFEPSKNIRKLLECNIETQNLSNVRIMPCALSSKNGTFEFTVPEQDSLAGSLRSIIEPQEINKEVVEVKRLSPFIDKQCDFIKLDIEGAEYAVLNDIKKKLNIVNNIFIEYHGEANATSNDLVNITSILVKHGFKFHVSKAFGTDKYTKISPFSHLNERYSQVIHATRDLKRPRNIYQKIKSFFSV